MNLDLKQGNKKNKVMAQYIDKAALVAEIKHRKKLVSDPILSDNDLMIGERNALFNLLQFIDTLEVKEVDLDNITGWFDHIAQIADNRTTLTGKRMTDVHALDEIKCLAKDSSAFITKYYKAQK